MLKSLLNKIKGGESVENIRSSYYSYGPAKYERPYCKGFCPDGGTVCIGECTKKLYWQSSNAHPFIKDKYLTNNEVKIGPSSYSHTKTICQWLNIDSHTAAKYLHNSEYAGRFWLITVKGGKIMVLSLWNYGSFNPYNDSIYYEIIGQLGFTPKKSFLVQDFNIEEIPFNNYHVNFSPNERLAAKMKIPVAKLNYLRHVDESRYEPLQYLNPDGGFVKIKGNRYNLDFDDNNAIPFLAHPKLTNNKIIFGDNGQCHLQIIAFLMDTSENGISKSIYDEFYKCSLVGRVWLIDDAMGVCKYLVMSLWDFNDMEGYSDRLYYEITHELGINPEIAVYGKANSKIIEIPSFSNELSPTQRKLIGSGMPEVKYRHYRYIDEDIDKYGSLQFIDPDGGFVKIDKKYFELNFLDDNAIPFLSHPILTNNKIVFGKNGETHGEIIDSLKGEKKNGNSNIIVSKEYYKCSLLGRVWLFNDKKGDCKYLVMSLWRYKGMEGYSDRLYYNIIRDLNINPELSVYGEANGKIIKIPSFSNELSPTQRKLIGSGMPEVKYRHYRYVDENKDMSNKKKSDV